MAEALRSAWEILSCSPVWSSSSHLLVEVLDPLPHVLGVHNQVLGWCDGRSARPQGEVYDVS
eukprot:751237-Hanusia_phi.AAC.6